jgi:hypothetical protein
MLANGLKADIIDLLSILLAATDNYEVRPEK